MSHRLSLDQIARASTVIDPVFLDTPQLRAESLEAALGCRLVVKVETLNPIRCFKGRGASFFAEGLPAGAPVVCASAGNFGQAMAYTCRRRGAGAVIFASVHANPLKVERMRALGADVRLHGADFDAAKLEAKRHAAAHGLQMVEDGLQPAISEGAGTIAVELLRWPESFDDLVVPLGNGALVTGMGRWMKAHAPATRVVGAAAARPPAQVDSRRSRRL
ncbi:MAG: threonine/serine dehydratase, partial [Gemmatimonas sp.]|uniref:threonine ammonia-lyase n=1 Tax=Gemmatimonas sp. TaxID=1962908 RepID=UPI00391F1090